MQRTITVIPATKTAFPTKNGICLNKRRVAAYARVSTDKDEQFTSYEAQIDYYTQYITGRSDWELVEVYPDEGISGLSTKNRDNFNRMIEDALSGKIDLIITKSISRFARNTLDTLSTIRKLKEKGVEVYFEKENIWTLDGKSELLLTIMSSLAQEESRSISENVTWGQRKRFSDGKVSLPYKHFLGYEKGATKDAPPVVNPEQAVTVRKIYSLFVHGMTSTGIAKQLTEEGIPTPSGKTKWQSRTIESILSNEKYRGSARLQKRYTVDFLTKKTKVNEGEVQQYYIEESHEAIIAPEEWDAVQDEIARRKRIGRAYSGKSIISTKVVCADCGSWYGPKTWHSTDKYKTVVWQCLGKFDKSKPQCKTPIITENDLKVRFLKVYNRIYKDSEAVIRACMEAKERLLNQKKLSDEMEDLTREMEVVKTLAEKCLEECKQAGKSYEETAEKYNSYVVRYEKAKSHYDELNELAVARDVKGRAIDRFINAICAQAEPITEFDDLLWLTVVDYVSVKQDGSLVFHFHGGYETDG